MMAKWFHWIVVGEGKDLDGLDEKSTRIVAVPFHFGKINLSGIFLIVCDDRQRRETHPTRHHHRRCR